ncbi:MAG: alpha-glucuronidase [Prevotella sp.]|nr:alpha-glucuronidase [Prevotella sp.]
MKRLLFSAVLIIAAIIGRAEDGSRLWLRLDANNVVTNVEIGAGVRKSQTVRIAVEELQGSGIGRLIRFAHDKDMTAEAYSIKVADGAVTIQASTANGLLYGAYALIRQHATGGIHDELSAPAFALRMLNHWDNPDLSVERGYAGKSIFKWEKIDSRSRMSDSLRERLVQYARANASIGINATVLNNVNASPQMLSTTYINKVSAIADILRPYGITVYLSVNFATPKVLGGLVTADPLDAQVQKWWKDKAKEIYRKIPDFGGFLVKANSEGQPGPGDYGRSHAEGANTLAAALQPYKGKVIWRCFVYGNHKGEDRVMQAINEFRDTDGKFLPNVILQAKNGPLDFQPREPYAPIFDFIKHTPMAAELQITQEYLGQSRHLVYLAPMWQEFFSFVAPKSLVMVAGVANIGDDANWCGHHFSQANWYAFGRMAWNPNLDSRTIADEWLKQTFTKDEAFVKPVAQLMMDSREACVNYMMPLGLHHIFKADHHYGPEPDGNQAHFPMEWRPVYYHKADANGIGFNRSTHGGTSATQQYREPFRSQYDDVATCPEGYLLWFHHLPWTYTTKSGRSLWDELCHLYNKGVDEVTTYPGRWAAVRNYVDEQRWEEVNSRIAHQVENAKEWRDACVGYFGSVQ